MVYWVPPGARALPPGLKPDRHGLVALGGTLNSELLVSAYTQGIFPWSGEEPIPWYSPHPRLVLRPERFRCSRSLRKVIRRGTFEVRWDTVFRQVMEGCAQVPRPGQDGTWILPNMIEAYCELHKLGVAHSVETYRDGELVGGLYGLSLGRAFFGESMFALVPNASKLALAKLCAMLATHQFRFVDCQQVTPHLLSLGAEPWARDLYLEELRRALAEPSDVRWSECR